SDLFIGKILEIPQDDDGTILGRQRRDLPSDRLAQLLLLQALLGSGVAAGDLALGFTLEGGQGFVQAGVGTRTTAPEFVQTDVYGDTVQPGGKARVAPERRQGPESPDKGFLGEVAGVLAVTAVPHREAVHPALVTADQHLKGGDIAGPDAANQLAVLRAL